jgi:hypothetical protein
VIGYILLGGGLYALYKRHENPHWNPVTALLATERELIGKLDRVRVTAIPTPSSTTALDPGMTTDDVDAMNHMLAFETSPAEIQAAAEDAAEAGWDNTAFALASHAEAVGEAKAAGASDEDIAVEQAAACGVEHDTGTSHEVGKVCFYGYDAHGNCLSAPKHTTSTACPPGLVRKMGPTGKYICMPPTSGPGGTSMPSSLGRRPGNVQYPWHPTGRRGGGVGGGWRMRQQMQQMRQQQQQMQQMQAQMQQQMQDQLQQQLQQQQAQFDQAQQQLQAQGDVTQQTQDTTAVDDATLAAQAALADDGSDATVNGDFMTGQVGRGGMVAEWRTPGAPGRPYYWGQGGFFADGGYGGDLYDDSLLYQTPLYTQSLLRPLPRDWWRRRRW